MLFALTKRRLNESQVEIINSKICPSFKENLNILPKTFVLHTTCRLKLSKNTFVQDGRLLTALNEMKNLPPLTRKSPLCKCSFCVAAEVKFVGLAGAQKRSRPIALSTQSTAPPSMTLCTKCFQKVGQGISHKCTVAGKIANLNLLLSPNTKDRLLSQHLKDKMAEEKSGVVSLATGGQPLNVSIQVPPSRSKSIDSQLSHKVMEKIETSLNLSERQTHKMSEIIRDEKGKKSIEPNLKVHLRKKSHIIDHFFTSEKKLFVSKNDKGIEQQIFRPVVYCKDVKGFIDFIATERKSTNNLMYKLGCDGGGGSLKICLNLIEQTDPNSPVKKKSKAGFLDSGVKKLFILAIVPSIPENYYNMRVLMKLIDAPMFDFTIATDLKLMNIITGIQSHSSRFPCTWCEACAPWEEEKDLRTLGRIRALVAEFNDAGRPIKKAQLFKNCINLPLLNGTDDQFIVDLLPPPELHLHLGITNKLFDTLNERVGNNKIFEWANQKNIVRAQYRGSSRVTAIGKSKRCCSRKFAMLCISHGKFNIVRKACFGKQLAPGYKESIEEFKTAFLKLNISIFPKIHALFVHVPQFCDRKKVGLGGFSEQASESVHSDFRKIWERFKLPLDHQDYSQNLLRTVLKYNSQHI